VYLKDKDNGDNQVFNKSYGSKAYRFLKEWDVIQFQEGSVDGKVMTNGARHEPVNGALRVETDYAGSRRLVVSKKIRDWNRFDRVGVKFKTNTTGSRVGVVLYPQGSSGQAGYYFVVDTFNKEERKQLTVVDSRDGASTDVNQTSPVIHGFYIGPGGNRTNMEFDLAKDFKHQSPTRVGIYNYLEVAVFPGSKGLEFEVYVNGQYCKTFIDKNNTLTRNQKAGMVFMGDGLSYVTKFYVVNYPKGTIREKDEENSDRFIRGKDLWRDRKASPGDGSFDNYLKSMEKLKKTQVYENDFSGRFYAVAREKLHEKVRFEEDKGGETSRLVVTNGAAAVVSYEPSSYGANFTLINKADKDILLKGAAGTTNGDQDKIESMYITGNSFRRGEDQEVEYKDKELIDRIGELPLEFESPWIQDRATAEDLARWVMKRFGDVSAKYTVACFGNPLLEIGDIVTIRWPEKGFTVEKSNPSSSKVQKFVISSISRRWNDGLETSVTVREII